MRGRAVDAVGVAGVVALALAGALVLGVGACKKRPAWEHGKKYLHYAIRARPTTLDPVRAQSQYNNLAQSQVYEPLYTYEYLERPLRIRPLLAAAMPEISEDGRVYTIALRRDLRFQDDACFTQSDGRGRSVGATDVIRSMMRMADKTLDPQGMWLYRGRIAGFDEFKQRMDARAPGEPFAWDAEIAGLRALDQHTLRIELVEPYPQLLDILAMTYTAVVPWECAEYYGARFAEHPVGTGPFQLREWIRGVHLIYDRNPNFRGEVYPSRASSEAAARGLDRAAGQRLPFLDGLIFHVFEQDQPMWLKFRVRDIDLVQVPAEYQRALFGADRELRPKFARDAVAYYRLPLLDFNYHGFNMDDEIVGRGPRARYLRQAISLAIDMGEINDAFYNGASIIYDGPIPPGLDGYSAEVAPYRGPDIERARKLLARAGYPDGEGLPALVYETDNLSISVQQTEMYARQLKAIGVRLEAGHHSFAELSEKLARRKAQIFRLAWQADYPDAENFLQLFYGPNQAPGANIFNYENPAYDRLFEDARVMQPGPERTALYRAMRQILVEDAPSFGSNARTRVYAWNARVRNVYPSETYFRWFKYLDLESPAGGR